MIRATAAKITRPALLTSRQRVPQCVRQQSSSSGGGGGGLGKFLVTTTFTAAALGGGTIGYAGYDPEFRTLVQDTVPGSKDILDTILGEPEDAKPKKPIAAPPSKMKITSVPSPPMPDIEKPAAPKKVEKKPEVKPEPAPVVKEQPKKVDAKPKEDPKQAAIVGLELALEEACQELDKKVTSALESGKASIDATKHHMSLVRGLMDDQNPARDEKRAWNEVFEAANKKSGLLKDMEKHLTEAKAALNKTIGTIEKGRANPEVNDIAKLKEADEKASASLQALEQVVASLDAVQKEAKLIDEYRSLVEEGRQQFQKEIEAILPDMKLSQSSGGLSEEELNIFMTHAYRKVCQLQDELAKVQTFGKRSSSNEERISSDDLDLQSELDAQRRELEVEHHRKQTALREEMEKEMRTQLRRQAAAHADHINDVLDVQAKEMTRLHERSLDENLNNERSSHKRELANIKGSLEGLNKTLEDKSFMANATFESQEFWLACIALQKTVENGADQATIEAKVKAIESVAQKSIAFQKDDLIQTLLKSIPKASQGVPPCSEIKTRFNKVEEMAKRTALIGDDGGSLFLYALSYLQSLLVISPSKTTAPPSPDEAIDVSTLNTFDIVWLARRAMEVDDLEQAIKYMNLLKGEPKRQASDWLSSARLHLEMMQTCEALASYATAIGAEAVPASKSSS